MPLPLDTVPAEREVELVLLDTVPAEREVALVLLDTVPAEREVALVPLDTVPDERETELDPRDTVPEDLDTDDDTVLLTELLVPEAALLTDLSPEELPLETVDAVLDTPEPEAILEIPDVLEPNEPVEFREPK